MTSATIGFAELGVRPVNVAVAVSIGMTVHVDHPIDVQVKGPYHAGRTDHGAVASLARAIGWVAAAGGVSVASSAGDL